MRKFKDGDFVRAISGKSRGFKGTVIYSNPYLAAYVVKNGKDEKVLGEWELQPWKAKTLKEEVEKEEKKETEVIGMRDMAVYTGKSISASRKRRRITEETLEDYREAISMTDMHGVSIPIVEAYENVCKALRKAVDAELKY